MIDKVISLWQIAMILPFQDRVVKDTYKMHFKCPICGDSKTNKSKKRGWITLYNNNLRLSCFNCGYNELFEVYLKQYYPDYYKDYIKELIKNKGNDFINTKKEPKTQLTNEDLNLFKSNIQSFKNLQHIYDLPYDHTAIKYLKDRDLDIERFNEYIYYTDNFLDWMEGNDPYTVYDPRIVFVGFNEDKEPIIASGRTIENKTPKYITYKFQEYDKLWGLDKIDKTKDVVITEGIIDAMFIENSLAIVGGMLSLSKLKKYVPLDKCIFALDNERLNEYTVKHMKTIIKNNVKIFIYPEKFKDFNDINDIKHRFKFTSKQLYNIIKDNSYSGLRAKLEFQKWLGGY